MAVTAATAGAVFSSGRAVVLFYSQMGWTSWIGVVFAAAMFGGCCSAVSQLARRTYARSFSGVYMRVLDVRQGVIVGVIHSLLMALTAVVMLAAVGELAALALPLHNACWMGLLFSLCVALLLNLRGMRAMPAAGTVVVAACVLFYAALALDPREISVYLNYETVPELSGSVTAALAMSTLHAALSASIGGGVTACMAGRVRNSMRFGVCCGALMLAMLSAANAAMLRGGEKLFSQALPLVLLAARWGKTGYYAGIVVMWMCSVTTLAAALGALIGQIDEGRQSRRLTLLILALSAAAVLWMGFERAVEVGYPMLGWASAFCLAGLACYCGRLDTKDGGHPEIMTKSRVKL